MMNYAEAVDFITKQNAPGSKYGLERIEELLDRLHNPERGMKLIHVAGTNGKGSVSRMLASVLMEAGYRVGSFNSPFISKINEYMTINGEVCSDEKYAEYAGILKEAAMGMEDRPTEFEMSFAMAMRYYYDSGCEFAVIEAGLGGANDATNAIPAPLLVIITNIGLDHTGLLGNTIEMIAKEKSGIIKKGCRVVAYPSDSRALKIISEQCEKCEADLTVADFSGLKICNSERISVSDRLCINYGGYKGLALGPKGIFQARNAAVVLEAVKLLKDSGVGITDDAVFGGIENCVWNARFEVLSEKPLVIADGGHNIQCIEALTESIEHIGELKKRNIIFVIGVMADKDYGQMFEMLRPYAVRVITTEPSNSRRLDAEKSAGIWRELGVPAEAVKSPSEAVSYAMGIADENSAIIAAGSLYMMDEIRTAVMFGKSE